MYNVSMTNILTSNSAKQLIGAVAGMAIAAVVYVGFDQASYRSLKGLLVSTKTISPSTDVNINAKNVDDSTLRRIAARAQTVAAALQNADRTIQAETPVTAFASSRRATRQFSMQLKELASSESVTIKQAEPIYKGTDIPPGTLQGSNLPNSGLGLNLLVLLALIAVFVSSKKTWRTRFASIISLFRLG